MVVATNQHAAVGRLILIPLHFLGPGSMAWAHRFSPSSSGSDSQRHVQPLSQPRAIFRCARYFISRSKCSQGACMCATVVGISAMALCMYHLVFSGLITVLNASECTNLASRDIPSAEQGISRDKNILFEPSHQRSAQIDKDIPEKITKGRTNH